MVIRSSWYESLTEAETRARSQLDQLSNYLESPNDLLHFSTTIGATTEGLCSGEHRKGALHNVGGKWVIRINGDISMAGPTERFTMAHELAHLMLVQQEVSNPISEEEYWTLEEVCDRLARTLLVPQEYGPSGVLEEDEVARWFTHLTTYWKISNEVAAQVICERTINCLSVAFLMDGYDEVTVDWSYCRDRSLLWPRSGAPADERLSTLKEQVGVRQNEISSYRLSDSTLIAFRSYLQLASHAMQMQLGIEMSCDYGSDTDGMVVAFALARQPHGGQLDFSFD